MGPRCHAATGTMGGPPSTPYLPIIGPSTCATIRIGRQGEPSAAILQRVHWLRYSGFTQTLEGGPWMGP